MNKSIASNVTDKREEDDYPFRKKVLDYRKFLKFYLIPIVSVLIFVILFIFTIVPNIKYMFDGLQDVNSLQDESKKLDSRINVLKTLKENEDVDRQTLGIINQLVPSENSEVVKFRQKVAEYGKQKGLEVESLKAGESILSEKDKNVLLETSHYQLIEIPSKFTFTGPFGSYRELLKTMYNGDDFFVISSMKLDVSADNRSSLLWRGDFDVIKYQFSQSSTGSNYSQVPETQPVNQSVVNFVRENFDNSGLNR
jgi:hypothetical protein